MRPARVGPPGAERPVVVEHDRRLLDLGSLTADIDFLSIQLPGLDAPGLPELADPGRRGPPIARPGKVIGIGLTHTSYDHEVDPTFRPRDGDVVELTAPGRGAQRTPFAAHAAR